MVTQTSIFAPLYINVPCSGPEPFLPKVCMLCYILSKSSPSKNPDDPTQHSPPTHSDQSLAKFHSTISTIHLPFHLLPSTLPGTLYQMGLGSLSFYYHSFKQSFWQALKNKNKNKTPELGYSLRNLHRQSFNTSTCRPVVNYKPNCTGKKVNI